MCVQMNKISLTDYTRIYCIMRQAEELWSFEEDVMGETTTVYHAFYYNGREIDGCAVCLCAIIIKAHILCLAASPCPARLPHMYICRVYDVVRGKKACPDPGRKATSQLKLNQSGEKI